MNVGYSVSIQVAKVIRVKDQHYNATVESIRFVHDELCILRVKPDESISTFEPGQYLTLGLLDSAPRVDDASQTPDPPGVTDHKPKLILRAYSVACTMLNDHDQLLTCDQYNYQEYYISRVTIPDDWEHHPPRPRLTPRLFNLGIGSRLYTTLKPKGSYVLGEIPAAQNIIFAATGTGEAPHNSMLAELLKRGHQGKIVSLCCVRYLKDSGYLRQHQLLMQKYPNYSYRLFTTREPENLNPEIPGYVGKQYLQEFFKANNFAHQLGWQPHPDHTNIYLCGNPEMIGIPHEEKDGTLTFPHSNQPGVVEILTKQGFKVSLHHEPGNIHFEKYW